jgi:hypothetical protein
MDEHEVEIDELDVAVSEEESDIDRVLEAFADPETFYAKNTFRVIYQTNNFLLPQLRDLIADRKVINIRPEYQRRLRWIGRQKSRLIESLLLNIPIPPVFLFEGEAARYEVMDGQQRLSAIKEFMNNEFRITALDVLWPLNGMNYADLPPRIKRGLDRAVVSAVVLLLESDSELSGVAASKHKDIRRFIFERLNTGGTRLNAQELRNAIYPGPFSDAIVNITRGQLFTQIWGIPPYTEADPNDYYENPRRQKNALYASMADCQIVLRFFALREEKNIRGSMKGILDRCMEEGQGLSLDDANKLDQEFSDRLQIAYTIFAEHPFELPPDPKGKIRLSVTLYDAIMVAVDRLWDQRSALLACDSSIRAAVRAVVENPDTAQVITGQGNTAQSIKDRLDLVERTISGAANLG